MKKLKRDYFYGDDYIYLNDTDKGMVGENKGERKKMSDVYLGEDHYKIMKMIEIKDSVK